MTRVRELLLPVAVGGLALVVGRATRGRTGLPAVTGADAATSTDVDVSVVVPARDEERSLPSLLDALRAAAPDAEWIVVDDGSRDRTAALARAAGATVVDPGPPPPGWTGKAWACHTGVQRATGRMLLLLDADTRPAPGALEKLLAVHAHTGGLVSVQPFHTPGPGYEQLSAGFNAVAALATGLLGDRPARRPVAFGPCLLTSRDELATAGGYAAVRGAVLDDLALADAYARAGLPTTCLPGGDDVRMRSYPDGPLALVAGWRKNMAAGAATAAPGPRLLAVAWVAAQHAVAARALGQVVRSAGGAELGATALAWAACAAGQRRLLARVGAFRWWTWALFPLPLAVFDAVFALSAVDTAVLRRVRWRGRAVRLG